MRNFANQLLVMQSIFSWFLVSHGPSCIHWQVAMRYSKDYGSDKVRVLGLEKNRGKGGAIRLVSGRLLCVCLRVWHPTPNIYIHTLFFGREHAEPVLSVLMEHHRVLMVFPLISS